MSSTTNPEPLFSDRQLPPVSYHKNRNYNLAYRYTSNNNNSETILFFYGFAGSMDMLEDFLSPMRANYNILVIDYPGHGYSEKSDTFSIKEFTTNCYEIVNALNIKKINLVGYSFGGIVALQFYKSYKEKINKFVLYHTLPKFSLNPIQGFFYKFYGFLLKHFFLTLLTKISIPLLKDKYFTKEHYNDAVTVIKHSDKKSVFENFSKIIFADYTSVLPIIECPVFVIGSKKDILAPEFAVKKMLKKLHNAKSVILKKYGHLSVVTAIDKIPQMIIDFFKE